eukprot:601646-Pyramimonas_sp.AAC.1
MEMLSGRSFKVNKASPLNKASPHRRGAHSSTTSKAPSSLSKGKRFSADPSRDREVSVSPERASLGAPRKENFGKS